MTSESLLVISAHVGDFVWRAGGAIALFASRGHRVTVACLAYGERGESAKHWRQGFDLQQVKDARHAEAVAAAELLGAELHTFDADDYPLEETPELLDGVVRLFRDVRPSVVLTHTERDPWNRDHETAYWIATKARIIAQAAGYDPASEVLGAPPVFLFEPHQTEYSGFMPDVLLDITEVWDTKMKAMRCMTGQEHLWDYYTDVAVRRGVQAMRNSGPNLGLATDAKAEAYQRLYPQVRGSLPEVDGVVVRRIARSDPGVVAELGEAGVATVHEAAGGTGLLDPRIRPIQDGIRIAGSAVTVSCAPGDNIMVHAAVEVIEPGDVLVVTTTSPSDHGMFGELLATSVLSRGCSGVVVDGGVRDVADLRKMGLPVWSAVVHARGTAKATPGSVNVPVVCGGIGVGPGDVIVADDDGVMVVELGLVEEVLASVKARLEKEDGVRTRLRAGELGVDLYGFRGRLEDMGVRWLDTQEP